MTAKFTTPDCGCRVAFEQIDYCPTHKAAPAMYELIKQEYTRGRISKKEADKILAAIDGEG